MNILIIYDSTFGNTEKIARAIGEGAGVEVVSAKDAGNTDLSPVDLLIVGSPTLGGRPTKAIQDFLNAIPADGLRDKKVATFDTRLEEAVQGFGLKLVLKTFKYAAEKMGKTLSGKGGNLKGTMGFFVVGKEGPLKEGEIERAKEWGRKLIR
ncbi:MAG: flavodoxin family protein [Patescibacteria group bacterium]|jgi:flavodoxin